MVPASYRSPVLAVSAFALFAATQSLVAPSSARADLNVVADIPPVHSLVSRVMAGAGTPDLLIPGNISPHDYALRPSDAQNLQEADLIVWVGDDLSPALERSIGNLAPDAQSLVLLDVPETKLLPFREGATFEAHDHSDHGGHEEHADHDDHDHDEHANHDDHDHDKHADHDDHDHDEHANHDDHDHEKHADHEDHDHDEHANHDDHDHEKHADHDDHDHDEHAGHDDHDHDSHRDAHAWLDPENAKIWIDEIAQSLANLDPDNAELYQANASEAQDELDALAASIGEQLQPVSGQGFIVFHDAYHYFEDRFDVEAVGAISLHDASSPGPARLREIRETLAETGAKCVFREPQFNDRLVGVVIEGTEVSSGVLDPIGVELEPGPELYSILLTNMANSLVDCLSD